MERPDGIDRLDLGLVVVSVAVSAVGILRSLRSRTAYFPSALSARLVTALVIASPIVMAMQSAAYSFAMSRRPDVGSSTTLGSLFLANILESVYLPIDQTHVDRLFGADSSGIAIALTAILLCAALVVVVAFGARARWSWYFVRGFAVYLFAVAPLRIVLLGRAMILSSVTPAAFGAVHGISLGLVVVRLLFAVALLFTLGSSPVQGGDSGEQKPMVSA